jgi:thiol-disulfide isomerase/thioredoxin
MKTYTINGSLTRIPMIKILFFIAAFFSFHFAEAQQIEKWKIENLEEKIKTTDAPTIINFWATFCKPCIEEMPYFQELSKKYEASGVKLILVSLDMAEAYPQKINNFIKKYKIAAPVVFLDETNADIFCPRVDESWSGAIPASLFINNKTGYRNFIEDQLTKEELEKEILALISLK